jgi:hypothetical protein
MRAVHNGGKRSNGMDDKCVRDDVLGQFNVEDEGKRVDEGDERKCFGVFSNV